MTKEWLLMKRGLYYRPNNCGYTGIKDQAGRYSYAEVEESVKAGNGVTGIHEPGAPDFTTACFDDLARDHLIKQRDAARAALKDAAIYIGECDPEFVDALWRKAGVNQQNNGGTK